MLVLLIIFMVAAPLSTVDVPVALPASSAPPSERPDDPLWLTLTADGRLVLDEQPVAAEGLAAALAARSGGNREAPVFLRADRGLAYGEVMGVLERLRGAGWLKVALVGQQDAAPAGAGGDDRARMP